MNLFRLVDRDPVPDQSLRRLLESEMNGKPEVVDAVLVGLAVAIAADRTEIRCLYSRRHVEHAASSR